MRIAMVVHNDVRKDARVMKEANTLRKAGHDIIVYGLTTEENGDMFTFGPDNIEVILSYRSPFGTEKTLLKYIPKTANSSLLNKLITSITGKATTAEDRIFRSFSYQGLILAQAVKNGPEPDVIHIHDHVSLTAASIYKSYFDKPLIWDAHEIYEDLAGTDPARGKTNAAIIEQNSHLIDQFITINPSIAKFYADKYSKLPAATILPNASMFTDRPNYDGRLHDAAGLDETQKILLFQGGISKHRGAEALVEAAVDFPDDWSLVFMGWGNLKDDLEITSLSYEFTSTGNERVCFIDGAPQEELALWTAGASLGAIPYENTSLNHLYCTPNKLWEYPLAGVPILASDLEEMGKTLREHKIGSLIPRDFEANDIIRIINELSDEKLKMMRSACFVFAGKNNWQINEQRLIEVYNSI